MEYLFLASAFVAAVAIAFLFVDLTGGKKLSRKTFARYLLVIAVSGGLALLLHLVG